MIFFAIGISIIPGVIGLLMDPDLLGISVFVIHALLVYIACRTRIVGGILLIGLAVVWIGFLVYNMLLEPMDFTQVLLWLGFAACPLIGGLLFLFLGKKK
jgi:hypothetical protein